jgi:hypothetical protein
MEDICNSGNLMAGNVKINIKNNKEIANILRLLPQQLKIRAVDIAEEELKVAASEAKNNIGTSNTFGDLAEGISVIRISNTVQFRSDAEHSAFAEFGIRGGYRPKRYFEKYAAKFQGISKNKFGVSAKYNIYMWAAKKGIIKKAWYPIYRKLIGHPIKTDKTGYTPINNGRGFFLEPYVDARDRIRKRLKRLLRKL